MATRPSTTVTGTVRSVLLMGVGACVLVSIWVVAAPRDAAGRARPDEASRAGAAAHELVQPPAAGFPERTAVAPGSGAASSDAVDAVADLRVPDARAPVTESDHLAVFLARAPESLARDARAVLAGDGPRCAKVALLRALEAHDAAAAVGWHELAARSLPDVSDAHGEGVPTFAIGRLAVRAGAAVDGRAALQRLAFETLELGCDLRRRAAAALVRASPASELAGLRVHLAREDDALLVAGVRATLAERADEAGALALLAALPDDPGAGSR